MGERSIKSLSAELKKIAKKPLGAAFAMPPELYTSQKWLAQEHKHIFSKEWLCAGRADTAPNAGDYFTYDIIGHPVFIIRQKSGELAAFSNVCLHRMMRLLTGAGNCKNIVCPYHAWTYDEAGQLTAAPFMNDREGFSMDKMRLPQIRCEVWQGWVYLTLNPKAKPVAHHLKELLPYIENYGMADYRQVVYQDHVWQTNWKNLTENFMEGYHLPVAHRKTLGGHFPVKETRFAQKTHRHFTLQTFTKKKTALVGNAHPANTTLKGEQRRTSVLVTAYPSHMYSLAPDHLWYLSLQPQGTDKVAIRFGAALAPEVMAHQPNLEQFIAKMVSFLHEVNEEDRFVVEGVRQAMQSSLAKPGPLCWLEREGHEFSGYLARLIKN